MRVALVSRELYPLGGGGIGQFVAATARLLSGTAEVTVLTTSALEETYERLRAERDPRLPGGDVRLEFVPEPTLEETDGWYHVMHCYGARVLERLKELYPDGGPDLIEFPDFLGEAFVTLQASEAGDPFLARTTVCVRIHSSAEVCQVLDGFFKRDLGSRAVHAMERFSLAKAHRLLWPGGDVLDTYSRFYGADSLAPATRIRHPYLGPISAPGMDAGYDATGPMRILYAGRIERRKGVHNLIRSVTGLPRDDFRLTLIGGDTDTAPLGLSMRQQLQLAIADDGRIELRDSVERGSVAEAIREHHVVVIPSLWECWPYAALESLHLNRPILATPVGGLVELVHEGRSGWLAGGTDHVALEAALEALLESRSELERIVWSDAPIAGARALSDEREILNAYRALADVRPIRRAARSVAGAAEPARIGDRSLSPSVALRLRHDRVAAGADASAA